MPRPYRAFGRHWGSVLLLVMSTHVIHVNSCNSGQFMTIHIILDYSCHSCQFMSFMSVYVIHVNSCQFMPFMSCVIGLFRKFSKVGRGGRGAGGRGSNMSSKAFGRQLRCQAEGKNCFGHKSWHRQIQKKRKLGIPRPGGDFVAPGKKKQTNAEVNQILLNICSLRHSDLLSILLLQRH